MPARPRRDAEWAWLGGLGLSWRRLARGRSRGRWHFLSRSPCERVSLPRVLRAGAAPGHAWQTRHMCVHSRYASPPGSRLEEATAQHTLTLWRPRHQGFVAGLSSPTLPNAAGRTPPPSQAAGVGLSPRKSGQAGAAGSRGPWNVGVPAGWGDGSRPGPRHSCRAAEQCAEARGEALPPVGAGAAGPPAPHSIRR